MIVGFLSSLYGRYVLLFILLLCFSLTLYSKMRSSIENSIHLSEAKDALYRENRALLSGARLMSDPGWMHASDRYERKPD